MHRADRIGNPDQGFTPTSAASPREQAARGESGLVAVTGVSCARRPRPDVRRSASRPGARLRSPAA
jgi:hypothetical protein